jgi:hypothetical protein
VYVSPRNPPSSYDETNYLLSPAHPTFGTVVTGDTERLDVDPRLLSAG